MKHKYYEIIVAKANNMDLVLLYRADTSELWRRTISDKAFPINDTSEYYLCHPKHAEACLHWLNGGEVQYIFVDDWVDVRGIACLWSSCYGVFTRGDREIRIKPKKEKRWVVYRTDGAVLGPFDSYEMADGVNNGQVIEIEVEV